MPAGNRRVSPSSSELAAVVVEENVVASTGAPTAGVPGYPGAAATTVHALAARSGTPVATAWVDSAPSVAARATSARSQSSIGMTAWASGSPNRQLYSTSRGPVGVIMSPA